MEFNYTMPSWSADVGSLSNVTCAAIRFLMGNNDTPQDIYVTGVQFELGSNATPFEHRSYGDELARCQRYYNRVVITGGVFLLMGRFSGGTGGAYCNYNYPVSMRAAPQNFEISDASTWYSASGYTNGIIGLSASNTNGCTLYSTNNTSVVANGLIFCQPSGSGTTYIAFEKEL